MWLRREVLLASTKHYHTRTGGGLVSCGGVQSAADFADCRGLTAGLWSSQLSWRCSCSRGWVYPSSSPSSASVFDLKDTVARADKSTDEHTHSRTTTGASLAKVARTLREKPREVGQGTKRTRREQDEVVGVEDEVNLEEKAQLLLLKASSP